jgi:hypothetical protein
MMHMTYQSMMAFAESWIAAWNRRDGLELNVIYEANLNGERKRACEIMQFDTVGRQVRGEALYGAII